MKKTISTFVLLFGLASTAAFAQTITLDYEAGELARNMSASFGINDADFMKLKEVNLQFLTSEAEIAGKYKNDAPLRITKLMEIQNMYDAQLQTFLNASQMQAYTAFKANNPKAYPESADFTRIATGKD